MRKRGLDFVNEIEKLKKDLEVQGKAFEVFQTEIKSEQRVQVPGNQN